MWTGKLYPIDGGARWCAWYEVTGKRRAVTAATPEEAVVLHATTWPHRVRRTADVVCDNVDMSPAEKFRAALELHEAGVAVMRQNLHRRNPDASAAKIEELLSAWLRTRPGAEHGDTAGRPTSRLRG